MIRRLFGPALIVLAMLTPALAAPITVGIARTVSAEEVRGAADAFVAEARDRLPDQELRILPASETGEGVLKAVQEGQIGIGIVSITVLGTGSASALVQPWQFADAEAVRRALASEVGAVVKIRLREGRGAHAGFMGCVVHPYRCPDGVGRTR